MSSTFAQFSSNVNDSIVITIEKLNSSVNSNFDDYAPIISANEEELYFTSKRPQTEKEIKKQKESSEAIYHSTWNSEKGTWKQAVKLRDPLNSEGRNNSNIGISNDGQQILIYKDDVTGNGNIFISYKNGVEWSVPVSIGESINSEYHESSATIAPDGRTIYFVSDRPEGSGGRDIWMSKKNFDNTWSSPKNLGQLINTKENEEAVFIHPDGKTLFFSSNGREGIGGYDIYYSTFNDGNWVKPVALAEPINTINNDLFFVLGASKKLGYYSTNSGSHNLFSINFEKIVLTNEAEPMESSDGLILLQGRILDMETGQPLEARIELYNSHTSEKIAEFFSNSSTGEYLISLPGGVTYAININKERYLFHSEHFTIKETSGFEKITKDYRLSEVKKGAKIVLNNVFFESSKSSLTDESKVELDHIVVVLNQYPGVKVEISGHTDSRGGHLFNNELSQARAHSVCDYLIAHGVDKSKLVYVGYGETKPRMTDEQISKLVSEKEINDAHAANRRTEIEIIDF
ncbi:MAG: OmpA family protein [Flavobacteriales bacterium]|nr:OmpA family protein [Flavobacteriales bacterium]